MKKLSYIAGTLLLASLATLAMAQQQSKVYREGGDWAQELTGSMAAVKNIHIKVDLGSVRVTGGSDQNITYTIRNRAYTSSEESARHQFDSYKINAWTKGDTAWISADWQGGRPRKFSGDFVISVPHDVDLVKVETEGGNVVAKSFAGRLEA